MSQEEAILEAARAIRPHLKNLLGDEADAVNSKLDELLQQAQNGQQVDTEIFTLLLQHTSTHEWLAEYLKGRRPAESETKSYQPSIGMIDVLQAPMYRCPHPDHQGYTVYQHSVGQRMQCPWHHIPLIRVTNNKGGEHADEIDGGTGR